VPRNQLFVLQTRKNGRPSKNFLIPRGQKRRKRVLARLNPRHIDFEDSLIFRFSAEAGGNENFGVGSDEIRGPVPFSERKAQHEAIFAAISSPIASDAVAPGLGAFTKCSSRSPSMK